MFEIRKLLCLGIFCLIINILILHSSQGAFLFGKVKDGESDKTLANIVIRMINPDNGLEFNCKSNKKGEFMRAGVPSGKYDIIVEEKSYQPYRSVVTIGKAPRLKIEIKLTKKRPNVAVDKEFNIAMDHFNNRRFSQAVEYFRKSLQKFPQSIEVKYNLGISLLNSGDFNEAESFLKSVLDLDKKMPGLYHALGRLYVKKKQSVLASKYFKIAIEDNPDDKMAHYYLGVEYFKLGEVEKALTCFEITIRMDNHFSIAYYQAGVAASSLGFYAKAISYLERFRDLEPKSKESIDVGMMIEELKKIKKQEEERK